MFNEGDIPFEMHCAGSAYDLHCNRFFESVMLYSPEMVEGLYAGNEKPIKAQCLACEAKQRRREDENQS